MDYTVDTVVRVTGQYVCAGGRGERHAPTLGHYSNDNRQTTGELLEQRELGPELEYGDPAECESMTARLSPLRTTGNLAAALTCRKVNRKDAVLL